MLTGGVPLGAVALSPQITDTKAQPYAANEILITGSEDTSLSSLPLKEAEVIETDSLENEKETVIKGTVPYGTDIEALCERLEKRSDIVRADPNYLQKLDTVDIPDEARRTGSDFNAFNWYRDALHLSDGWRAADTLGSASVTVAVIDTGINTEHKEFEGALWTDENGNHGYNAVDKNYDVSDNYGHGSNVAGIIGMRANDYGYVGIAPGVKLMALKAGESLFLSDSDILTCLNFAVEHGADIINMSFGSKTLSPTMALAYQRAASKAVLIAAAGNDGNDAAAVPQYPAACSGILGVMSYGSMKKSDLTNYTLDNGALSPFSNYDKTGKYYQIAAPGVEVAGPAPSGSATGFTFKTGTSQATPIVAGAAALYLSMYPDATPYQVKEAILSASDTYVKGAGDDDKAIYKRIDFPSVFGNAPAEEPTIALSPAATALLGTCIDKSITRAHISDLEALTLIPGNALAPYREHLEIIAELNTVQSIDLSGLDLSDKALKWFEGASFEKLYSLNLDNNPDLHCLTFGAGTAPTLTVLSANHCALEQIGGLEYLPHIHTISLAENRFDTSYDFENLQAVSQLNVSSCRLQDVICFKTIGGLTDLDVSDNYISDISPLAAFKGNRLNIAKNPLHLGEHQKQIVNDLKSFMRDNSAAGSDIVFQKNEINGAHDKTYIQSETICAANIAIPRTQAQADLTPVITPQNANVSTKCRFVLKDNTLKNDVYNHIATWVPQNIAQTIKVNYEVQPLTGLAAFPATFTIMAPEVVAFTYAEGKYTLLANTATDYIEVAGQTISAYSVQGDCRAFAVPGSLPYSSALKAIPFDAVGAGTAVSIGTSAPEPSHGSSVLFSFEKEKTNYHSGETALFTIRANENTAAVKLYNYTTKQTVILKEFTEANHVRTFTARYLIPAEGNYKFKAYASADGSSFYTDPLALQFSAYAGVIDLQIGLNEGPFLYLGTGKHRLQSTFYPADIFTDRRLSYESANPAVAAVDDAGCITAKSYGKTTITATALTGLQATYTVFVNPPEMSVPVADNTTGIISVYTKGATDIALVHAQDPETEIHYTAEAVDSDKADYDKLWHITLLPGETPDTLPLKIYALDTAGITAKSNYMSLVMQPVQALQSFDFEKDNYTFDRAQSDICMAVQTVPASGNFSFEWSSSDTETATVSGQGATCRLTPKKSGTVTLTATADIAGKRVSKTARVTFTAGKIHTLSVSNTAPACYEAIEITVQADKSITRMQVTDATNNFTETYPAAAFCTPGNTTNTWSLPFYFKRDSHTMRITAADACGNCDTVTKAVNATMPESGFAASPAIIKGEVGTIAAMNLINLPARTNISNLRYTGTVDDTDIATFNVGNIRFLKEGQTTLHCTYNGEVKDVCIYAYVNITSIRLESEKILYTGESVTLNPQTVPASATRLSFESDNPVVAQVDKNGLLTANAPGSANIIVRAVNGVQATMRLTVKEKSESDAFCFDRSVYESEVGSFVDCTVTAPTAPTLISSNTNVITVEGTRFKAVKEGTAIIYAMLDSTHIIHASVTVHANRTLTLSKQVVDASIGDTAVLFALLMPSAANLDGIWYSDNESVAVVNDLGIVYTKSAGSCHIYFVSDRGEVAACTVNVTTPKMESLSILDSEIQIGANQKHIILYSENAASSEGNITFESEDESIAAVDQNGIVYGVGAGRTLINIYLENGTAYCLYVTVNDATGILKGSVNAENVRVSFTDATGKTTQSFKEIAGAFSLTPHRGSYTVKITADHRTAATFYEADIFTGAIDLGNITLYNGDANKDGSVDIADISVLLKATNYGASARVSKKNYDMNDDFTIDILDIGEILLADNYGGSDTVTVL